MSLLETLDMFKAVRWLVECIRLRVVPTRTAMQESVELAHEIFNVVFRKLPGQMEGLCK